MTVGVAESLTLAAQLRARVDADPTLFIRWYPNQWNFLRSKSKCKQIRQGNQWGGKTWAALSEVIGRCIGRHPLGHMGFRYPPSGPGFEAWVICDSWSQSIAIMGKIRALLPVTETDPATIAGFNPATGFRGKNPIVKFRNGAILRIKTANQNPKSLASGTIDVALFDEPPTSTRLFTEVQQRLQHKGGVLLLSYTPVNAPVEYLQQYVADGLIEDHHMVLTPAALIPVGSTRAVRGVDGVLRDAAWIAELRATVSPIEAPVVIDGEWEFRAIGAYFDGAWDPLSMVHTRAPTGIEVQLCIGIDFGTRPGKQIVLLMAVWMDDEGQRCVYVIDEYVDATGTATPAEDADGIIDMLDYHGQTWSDLKYAHGDRVHMQGQARQKSNKDLSIWLAKRLKRTVDTLRPYLETVKRGAGRGRGSVDVGSKWLFYAMVKRRFAVHPRCKRLIAALPKFNPSNDDDWKDPVDALRYGLDPFIFAPRQQSNVQVQVR